MKALEGSEGRERDVLDHKVWSPSRIKRSESKEYWWRGPHKYSSWYSEESKDENERKELRMLGGWILERRGSPKKSQRGQQPKWRGLIK